MYIFLIAFCRSSSHTSILEDYTEIGIITMTVKNYVDIVYLCIYIYFYSVRAQLKQCHVINLLMINYISFIQLSFALLIELNVKILKCFNDNNKTQHFLKVTEFYFITDPPAQFQ